MTERPTSEQLMQSIGDDDRINAPSAASAEADCPECPVPVTAWTGDDDAKALADGLKMQSDPAQWAFARLSRLIADFEAKLDEDHEVGARIVNGPGDMAFAIQDVGFWGPDLILFMGANDHGKPVRLVQHYTQLNVMLSAMPKPKAEEPPRRIGFELRQKADQVQA